MRKVRKAGEYNITEVIVKSCRELDMVNMVKYNKELRKIRREKRGSYFAIVTELTVEPL